MLFLLFFIHLGQGNETLVTKTTVTVPVNGGPVEAVSTIESVPYWTRSRRKTGTVLVIMRVSLVMIDVGQPIQANILWPRLNDRVYFHPPNLIQVICFIVNNYTVIFCYKNYTLKMLSSLCRKLFFKSWIESINGILEEKSRLTIHQTAVLGPVVLHPKYKCCIIKGDCLCFYGCLEYKYAAAVILH